MKNLILKHGDSVKALRSTFGLVKGRTYLVESSGVGLGLEIRQGLPLPLTLVWYDGSLGPMSDAVAVLQCPLVLPRGNNEGMGTL